MVRECPDIQLLSYSSGCYSNLALLNIFSYLYIYLCGSFFCIFYFGFLILFDVKMYLIMITFTKMAHVFRHCPLINFVKTKPYRIYSLP